MIFSSYDHSHERCFCLSCNDSVEEEKRRLRRSSPFPSPVNHNNFGQASNAMSRSMESLPKPNFDDAMEVDD